MGGSTTKSCVGMNEEDIWSLSEEKCVCGQCPVECGEGRNCDIG